MRADLSAMDSSQYSKLLGDAQGFLSKRYDLFLLRLLEKASIIIGLIITLVVVLFLCALVVLFAGIAMAYVLGQWLPMWAAFLIIGGLFVLLLVPAVIFRRQWFVNPIVAILSSVLFSNNTSVAAGSPAESSDTSSQPENEKGGAL